MGTAPGVETAECALSKAGYDELMMTFGEVTWDEENWDETDWVRLDPNYSDDDWDSDEEFRAAYNKAFSLGYVTAYVNGRAVGFQAMADYRETMSYTEAIRQGDD